MFVNVTAETMMLVLAHALQPSPRNFVLRARRVVHEVGKFFRRSGLRV